MSQSGHSRPICAIGAEPVRPLPQQRNRDQRHQQISNAVESFRRRSAHQPKAEKVGGDGE